MRNLTATICLTIAVLLGSVGVGFALPKCEGSPRTFSNYKELSSWSNCEGTVDFGGKVKYVGQWKKGKEHGQGTLIFPNGNKFVGEFKNHKKNGKGTYTWASDNKYVGEYRNNKRNGQGTLTWASGSKYVGEWKHDKFNGQGTYTWKDGKKYVGEYRDSNRHGQGIQYHADGTIENKGLWRNNKFMKTKVFASPGSTKVIDELNKLYTLYHFLNLCEGSNITSTSVMKSVQKDINSSANSLFEKYKIPNKKHDEIKDISWEETLKEFNEDSINKLLMATGFGKPMGLSRKQRRQHKKTCSETVVFLRLIVSQLQGSNQGKTKKRKF